MTDKELRRFEAKYIPEPNSGCWLWTGSLNSDGYSSFYPSKKGHRISFEHWVGEIPPDKEIDHLCGVRCCVNPKHLQAVTHKENLARSMCWKINPAKTHCPKGHPYSGDNLYIAGTNRQCNICRRARSLAFDRARKRKG